jgi:hypothetical protein
MGKFNSKVEKLESRTVSWNGLCSKFEVPLYLRYLISDYKSYLEDKLQTRNKINGVIRRHFGKQATEETKLRIHSITSKAALKFGSEAWMLKKTDEQRMETE